MADLFKDVFNFGNFQFTDCFEDRETIQSVFNTKRKTVSGTIYEWKDSHTLWVHAAGATKEDVDASVKGDSFFVKWETPYNKANFFIKMPKGTESVEVEVVNGMIVANFVVKPSDVSVIIK